MSVWREAMQTRQTFIRLHQYTPPPPHNTTTHTGQPRSVKLYSRSNTGVRGFILFPTLALATCPSRAVAKRLRSSKA